MDDTIASALAQVQAKITTYAHRYERNPASIQLLAVSKKKPSQAVLQAIRAGQQRFGESYAREAVEKILALSAEPTLEWHFIGPLQTNKTRIVAEHFAWLHSLDQIKHAERLSAQRPANLLPLQVCIQVNICDEPQKAGISLADLDDFAMTVNALPGLCLRGLMTLPAPSTELAAQREPFCALHQAYSHLQTLGLRLDTLSMGMSSDLEAAIAEGATIVRVGTAIFGSRISK